MTYTRLHAFHRCFAALLFWAAAPFGCGVPSAQVQETGVDGGVDTGTDTGAPADIGGGCAGPTDCVEGALCIGNPKDEYTCMRICPRAGRLCEDGSVCAPVTGAPGVCYLGGFRARGAECESNLQCEPGLVCAGVDDNELHCLEACHIDDGGCEEDEFCRTFEGSRKGVCRTRVGAPCDSAANCPADLACVQTVGETPFANGYCSRGCSTEADCPHQAHCRRPPGEKQGVCLAPCTFRAECQFGGGYRCLDDSTCRRTDAPEACRAFRGDASFCVPPALLSFE